MSGTNSQGEEKGLEDGGAGDFQLGSFPIHVSPPKGNSPTSYTCLAFRCQEESTAKCALI